MSKLESARKKNMGFAEIYDLEPVKTHKFNLSRLTQGRKFCNIEIA
jgi:hypothetical protein